MIKDYLKEQILANFGYSPTNDQEKAVNEICNFIFSADPTEAFLLRGYAGTGKTSLVAALVKTMEQLERTCVLMAPTGRAAKVFALYANHPAFTIHKRIYRQKSIDQDSLFTLNYNMLRNVLFVVDEASMINNGGGQQGSLLEDLITFIYGANYTPGTEGNGSGPQISRLLLVGDDAQLPPVGEADSPALCVEELRALGLTVREVTLRQVVRQAESSGILWNATRLRQLMAADDVYGLPQIRFSGFADVKNIPGNELIETISNCYARYGMDETMVVCRSNKRANAYNQGIRYQILGREEEMAGSDRLMVAKNNYFWLKPEKDATLTFLANGDIVTVEKVRNERELYGFRFVDCTLRLSDYDDQELEATLLLDTLHNEAPALTPERQQQLFESVMEDYADIPQKRERLKKMKEDPYFNALQVKYAYAVTCHKAQGGQWSHLFIDQGYMTEEMLGPDYFRWLYTAITRATQTVYFVNWREEQTLASEAYES